MTTTLYGIKNCDTVKKARRWLDDNGVDYRFHDFRADGIDRQQVDGWLQSLGAATLVNKRSTTWKSLDDTEREQALNDKSAAGLLVDNPTLIKRPVLETGKDVSVGFKPEDYQARLLD